MRRRCAPSESRTAISRLRESAIPASSALTLVHVMSSTSSGIASATNRPRRQTASPDGGK